MISCSLTLTYILGCIILKVSLLNANDQCLSVGSGAHDSMNSNVVPWQAIARLNLMFGSMSKSRTESSEVSETWRPYLVVYKFQQEQLR